MHANIVASPKPLGPVGNPISGRATIILKHGAPSIEVFGFVRWREKCVQLGIRFNGDRILK